VCLKGVKGLKGTLQCIKKDKRLGRVKVLKRRVWVNTGKAEASRTLPIKTILVRD